MAICRKVGITESARASASSTNQFHPQLKAHTNSNTTRGKKSTPCSNPRLLSKQHLTVSCIHHQPNQSTQTLQIIPSLASHSSLVAPAQVGTAAYPSFGSIGYPSLATLVELGILGICGARYLPFSARREDGGLDGSFSRRCVGRIGGLPDEGVVGDGAAST